MVLQTFLLLLLLFFSSPTLSRLSVVNFCEETNQIRLKCSTTILTDSVQVDGLETFFLFKLGFIYPGFQQANKLHINENL